MAQRMSLLEERKRMEAMARKWMELAEQAEVTGDIVPVQHQLRSRSLSSNPKAI